MIKSDIGAIIKVCILVYSGPACADHKTKHGTLFLVQASVPMVDVVAPIIGDPSMMTGSLSSGPSFQAPRRARGGLQYACILPARAWQWIRSCSPAPKWSGVTVVLHAGALDCLARHVSLVMMGGVLWWCDMEGGHRHTQPVAGSSSHHIHSDCLPTHTPPPTNKCTAVTDLHDFRCWSQRRRDHHSRGGSGLHYGLELLSPCFR